MALILSPKAKAQISADQNDIQQLYEKLEALTQTVEEQALALEEQAAEIAALRAARLQSATDGSDPAIHVSTLDVDNDAVEQSTDQPIPAEETPTTDESGEDDRIGRYPDTAIVRPGDFEGSITIPDLGGSFRIGGFVRAQINYDIDNIGVQDSAIPYTIPLDGSIEDGTDQLGFGVRDSQLNFDYRRETDLGLFRAFIEFDFFGDGDEFNNDYGARLRHAAVGLGNLQFGQFWSLFTDLNSTPEVADLLGPHGAPILRTPGLRWHDEFGDKWKWAIGVENPAGDITADASDLASESVPNIVGYVERTGDWGHIRVSGIGQELRSTTDKVFTGGISLTGRIAMPFFKGRDNVVFGGQAGSGFAKQYAGFGGVGLDGVIDESGNVDATEILAGYVGYQHWWTDDLRSTAYVSVFDFDSGSEIAPDSLSQSFKTAGNLFWTPVKNATVGAEIIYITRETVAGDEGEGVRMQAVAQFNF